MYQYYNYLIFERNKESFNDINPDLRKMTYRYDSEVKNAYMTVQASPEVIKAAMGMIPKKTQPEGKLTRETVSQTFARMSDQGIKSPLEMTEELCIGAEAKEILQDLLTDPKTSLLTIK